MGAPSSVDFNASIFVTMNPRAGLRRPLQLPDNLKALFRAVAMSKPDNEMIAEVMMYSEGFETASGSKKLVAVFQLSRQLSRRSSTTTGGCARSRRSCASAGSSSRRRSASWRRALVRELEEQLLIKALRVNTLSKLTHGDTDASTRSSATSSPAPGDGRRVREARGGGGGGARRGEARGPPQPGAQDHAVLRGDDAADGRRHRRPERLRQVDHLARAAEGARQARPAHPHVRDEQVDAARATARPWTWTRASGSTAC